MMASTIFIHKTTGEIVTQVPILKIADYREATEEEITADLNRITDDYCAKLAK